MSGISEEESEWHPELGSSGGEDGQTGINAKATTAKSPSTIQPLFRQLPLENITKPETLLIIYEKEGANIVHSGEHRSKFVVEGFSGVEAAALI